jgi:hypothetical protein
MIEAEEKVGKFSIYFQVVDSPFVRFVPIEHTILTGTKQECLDELRGWVKCPHYYLEVLEVLEVKENQ